MKKFIFIITLCLTAMSCAEYSLETPEMVTISFTENLPYESGSMTRVTNEDFLNTIVAHTPEYVDVTLTNVTTGNTYTCKSYEQVTVPIGDYNVSANYTAKDSTEPSLAMESFDVYIAHNNPSVYLDMSYDCYAVFALANECESCNYNVPGTDETEPFTKQGEIFVGYFTDDRSFELTPVEGSDDFVPTTYSFSTTETEDKVYAEYGKYYVIHPTANPKTTGSFIAEIPAMTEGNL